jgi:hypothetical protein
MHLSAVYFTQLKCCLEVHVLERSYSFGGGVRVKALMLKERQNAITGRTLLRTPCTSK